ELLRHRLARGRLGPRSARLGDRQLTQRRVRTGRPEHERDARPRPDHRSPVKAPVVLKFGGELREDPARMNGVAASIAGIVQAGTPLVIVHGGGKEIDAALRVAGIEKRQVEGLRITDEATLEVVVSVLAGSVNTRFVASLTAAGVPAVGLTGADGGCGLSDVAPPHRTVDGTSVELGRVGLPNK